MSSNSLDLTVMGRNVSSNTVALRNISISDRRIEKLLQRIEKLLQRIDDNIFKCALQHPTTGIDPDEALVNLLNAIGRDYQVPMYLSETFDVCNDTSIIPGSDQTTDVNHRCSTAFSRSSTKTNRGTTRSFARSIV